MARYIHSLAAFLFYLLAGSFFVAYVLLRNNIAMPWPQQWMMTGDLPLLFVAILYGGLSMYLSVTKETAPSRVFASIIAVLGLLLFGTVAFLHFWQFT